MSRFIVHRESSIIQKLHAYLSSQGIRLIIHAPYEKNGNLVEQTMALVGKGIRRNLLQAHNLMEIGCLGSVNVKRSG